MLLLVHSVIPVGIVIAHYCQLRICLSYSCSLVFLCLFSSDISAYPDSVNVLENIRNDVRTPDKLIDGINDTMDGGHMWLAPILPNIVSSVPFRSCWYCLIFVNDPLCMFVKRSLSI